MTVSLKTSFSPEYGATTGATEHSGLYRRRATLTRSRRSVSVRIRAPETGPWPFRGPAIPSFDPTSGSACLNKYPSLRRAGTSASAAGVGRIRLVCSQVTGTVSWWLTWLIFHQIGMHR